MRGLYDILCDVYNVSWEQITYKGTNKLNVRGTKLYEKFRGVVEDVFVLAQISDSDSLSGLQKLDEIAYEPEY